MMNIWKCNILLKVKIFMWMAAHNRIQSGVQLKKKKWSGPEKCAACDELERPYIISVPHCRLPMDLSEGQFGMAKFTN